MLTPEGTAYLDSEAATVALMLSAVWAISLRYAAVIVAVQHQ